MYAPQFDYHRAGSVAEALQLLADDPEAKLLAGGHSLIPLLKLRLAAPSALIDIGRIDALRRSARTPARSRSGRSRLTPSWHPRTCCGRRPRPWRRRPA